jgi:hypothetical protein
MNVWQKVGLRPHESDLIDSFCGKLNRKLKINRMRQISEKVGDKYRKIGGKPGILSNSLAKNQLNCACATGNTFCIPS